MLLKDIKIDPEFKKRLREQTQEEADAMRKSIDECGYINPLIVWKDKGVLVDGHHRHADWLRRMAEYEAAKPKGVLARVTSSGPKPPATPDFIQMEFKSREEVLTFIDTLQYAKRNLSEGQMAFIRARFIAKAKSEMPEGEAVKAATEKFDISPASARRDAQLATALDAIAPIIEAKGKTVDEVMSQTDSPTRRDIVEAAKLAESNPTAAVALLERDAKDKRCKPRLDGPEALKPPAWERHLAALTKAIDKLWEDSVDEERKAVRLKLGEFLKHVKALDSVAA